jgi:plasmid replication initiation protein
MISKDDEDFKLYVIKAQDFKELTAPNQKLGGSAYKQLIDACNELMDKRIEFDEGEEVGFMLTRWIASAEYFAGAGEIEIEISQKLRPLLLQLKQGNYLNYELGNILALKSTYVIRLYEMLKHEYNKVVKYKPNTTAVVHEINIDWLRNKFKIPTSYQYSSHIKKLIFDKAVKQFKQHTDIEISYVESRKRGKKVLAVEFTIRANDGLSDFLKDLKTFIAYMRKNYVNQDIWQGQGMILSVDTKGRIYNKKTLKEYNYKDAKIVWQKWYELAKENKLLILKQGLLF